MRLNDMHNPDAENTGHLYATGCSWSYRWPGHIQTIRDITWDSDGGGASLRLIHDQLTGVDLTRYGWVVVQLPTPIRSVSQNHGQRCNTLRCFAWFLQHAEGAGEAVARRVVLGDYRKTMLRINALHPRVVFLCYNVGGYPFRTPFDFGTDVQGEMGQWASDEGLRYAVQDCEGLAGFAKREHRGTRSGEVVIERKSATTRPGPRWHIVDPPGKWIEDAHPNEAADKLAAGTIERYIDAMDS